LPDDHLNGHSYGWSGESLSALMVQCGFHNLITVTEDEDPTLPSLCTRIIGVAR